MKIKLLTIVCILLFSQGIKAQIAKNYKDANWGNPISSCVFCADPTAIEHDGRLYVYGTNDQQEFDAKDGKGQNEAQRIYPVGKAWLIKNKVVPLQHESYPSAASHPSGCADRQL